MKKARFQLLAITLIASLQSVSGQDLRGEKNFISERNRHQFLQYLIPVLRAAGGVGRLYYRTDCWTEDGDGILFPQLELEAPAQTQTGSAAIRDIFRNERQVTVTEGQSGISRISIGKVSYELLHTKMHLITFKPSERYNDNQAISAIERTKEFQAKLRELKIEHAPTIYSGRVLEAAPGLPHLPASLRNMTVDEALDQVAQTFGGLVTYGECVSANGTRLFSIDFNYIR